eukprot:sb/3475840/
MTCLYTACSSEVVRHHPDLVYLITRGAERKGHKKMGDGDWGLPSGEGGREKGPGWHLEYLVEGEIVSFCVFPLFENNMMYGGEMKNYEILGRFQTFINYNVKLFIEDDCDVRVKYCNYAICG